MFIILLSGCNEPVGSFNAAEKRPLGSDLDTFTPSEEQAEPAAAPRKVEPTGEITLKDALAMALMYNPQLRAYSWEVRAADARRIQAGLSPNPELGVDMEGIGGTGERKGFRGVETTIFFSQEIETAGKRTKRETVAELDRKLSGFEYESRRLQVLTDTTQAFQAVLAAQQNEAIAEEMVEIAQQMLDTVSETVRAGKETPTEQSKAAILLSEAKIARKKRSRVLESASRRLAATWASESPKFTVAAGQLDHLIDVPPLESLADLLEKNPELEQSRLAVRRAKAALELEKARAVPNPAIAGGWQRLGEASESVIVAGIAIPLPISDRNQGGKLEAVYNLAKAKELLQATRAELRTELDEEYAKLLNGYTEASELAENILPASRSVLDAATTAYRQGKVNYLYVLDAQREFFKAQSRYVNALQFYKNAKAEIERLTGRPLGNEIAEGTNPRTDNQEK